MGKVPRMRRGVCPRAADETRADLPAMRGGETMNELEQLREQLARAQIATLELLRRGEK